VFGDKRKRMEERFNAEFAENAEGAEGAEKRGSRGRPARLRRRALQN
jgi:hypothetical protein